MSDRAVFLDRDGVLVESPPGRPINKVGELKLIDGVAKATRIISDLGFMIVVITNQGGIAKGFMTDETMVSMNLELTHQLKAAGGIPQDAVYWCPHYPSPGVERCSCRKPKPGLLLKAAADLGIKLEKSYMAGDMASDLEAGSSAGVLRTFAIQSPISDFFEKNIKQLVYPSLLNVAQVIKAKEGIL